MQGLEIELGPDETIVATQLFQEGGELGDKAVLTNRRLVILTRGARESHPLNKIQSIRMEVGRNVGMIVVWTIMAMVGLAPAGLIGATLMTAAEVPGVSDHAREQYPVVVGGLVLTFFSIIGLALAMRQYVRLAVDLQSGVKTYAVRRKDSQFLSFIQKVEQSI